MSTSRGSDEDWATLGLGAGASVICADPWSAIIHRQDTAKVITLASAVTADDQGKTDERQVDVSGTTAKLQSPSSTGWWPAEASTATSTYRMSSEIFPALGAFQTTLQDVTGVPDDTERLIDDANDRSIL